VELNSNKVDLAKFRLRLTH